MESNKRFRNSGDEFDKSTLSQSTEFGESSFNANESQSSSHNLSNSLSVSSGLNKDTLKMSGTPSSSVLAQKLKYALEAFPWLHDIELSIQKCLGSITEVKSKTILNAMDFLIR